MGTSKKNLEEENKELKQELEDLKAQLKNEQDNAIKRIQENCDHEFGPVNWMCSIGGWRRCMKCGYTENYIERD